MLKKIKSSRKAIGFFTSAGHSYNQGYGVGKAWILKDAI